MALRTFSERIAERLRLWWRLPPRRGEWITRYAPHQLRERYALRRAHEPDEAWHCCALWQRTLINKWNSREFVTKHGGRVPALYWRARLPSRRRLAALPAHFVIRPIAGTARRGVYVVSHGRDLLRDAPFSSAVLRRSILAAGRLAWTQPILAEEFIRSESGEYRLPVEYKCHTFGDAVAAIQVMERTGVRARAQRFYTPGWQPFADEMNTDLPLDRLRDPPRCLDEILALATRLGQAFGTYVRIDCFATDAGCVFNEFASTPTNGRLFTPYCDELFGTLWQEKFPDAT